MTKSSLTSPMKRRPPLYQKGDQPQVIHQ